MLALEKRKDLVQFDGATALEERAFKPLCGVTLTVESLTGGNRAYLNRSDFFPLGDLPGELTTFLLNRGRYLLEPFL